MIGQYLNLHQQSGGYTGKPAKHYLRRGNKAYASNVTKIKTFAGARLILVVGVLKMESQDSVNLEIRNAIAESQSRIFLKIIKYDFECGLITEEQERKIVEEIDKKTKTNFKEFYYKHKTN